MTSPTSFHWQVFFRSRAKYCSTKHNRILNMCSLLKHTLTLRDAFLAWLEICVQLSLSPDQGRQRRDVTGKFRLLTSAILFVSHILRHFEVVLLSCPKSSWWPEVQLAALPLCFPCPTSSSQCSALHKIWIMQQGRLSASKLPAWASKSYRYQSCMYEQAGISNI